MGVYEIDKKLTITTVDRMEWGKMLPRKEEMIKVKYPFKWLRFAYNNLDREGNTDLMEALHKWEYKMMEEHLLPDIPYNFMIGEDGTIYEGRGWKMDGDRPMELVKIFGKCLDIAYIGDYYNNPPSWPMLYAAHNLMLYGIKEKMIWTEVRAIPYNNKKTLRHTMGRYDVDDNLFLSVVDRDWWGDLKPNKDQVVDAIHPFTMVRFTYDNLQWDPEEIDLVGGLMRWEKKMMEEKGLPDIPYNFLIGNGAIVYEGRGWYKDADRPTEMANVTGKCLDIAYIGDFSENDPPWENVYTAHNLILYGIKQKFISREFMVIPYNLFKPKVI